MSEPHDERQRWIEAVWAEREERVYRSLFGDLGPGIAAARPSTYARYGKPPFPGWLHHGVLSCPPGPARGSWLHVTSGMSNPWNADPDAPDPSGHSGLGFELLVETSAPAPWAVELLHNLMAYEQLVATGAYPGAQLLEYGNRVPLGGPIDPGPPPSRLTWVLVVPPVSCASRFQLASGAVDLFQLVGITAPEAEFAGAHGNDALLRRLRPAGQVVDPSRTSAV